MKELPKRTCMGCQEIKLKKDLIRIVKNKQGEIFVDKTSKANGRGAYICNSKECLEKVMKSKRLEKVFEQKIDDSIYESLKGEIGCQKIKFTVCFGLATRAGKISFGTESTLEVIKDRKAKLVILAKDASDRTKNNFKKICDEYKVTYREFSNIENLSKCIGKDNKAVIAIKDVNFSSEIIKMIDGGEIIG